MRLHGFVITGLVALTALCSVSLAETVPVSILHTNDLHSHFRSEKNALGLGGVARLKTVVDYLRETIPHTLLVDGGDWSEGNIYYTEGTGGENLKMMDHIGYDAAVVGNHDWLNGPDVLLNAIANARPKVDILASNVDARGYDRGAEFTKRIQPYTIKEINGVKIAFIGIVTFELIYDRYFKPIKINEPLFTTRRLSHWLKKEKGVDAVIAISHNNIMVNEVMLKFAPEVDLVIGAHDHKKLSEPKIVKRMFHQPAWIVETGCWGRFLGRVDMKITPREEAKKRKIQPVQLVNYTLTQLDSSVPENPETLTRIESLEREIEKVFGPIFNDHIGDSEVEVSRQGLESPMGNLTTDSYRYATHADVAFDNVNFIYGELHEGPINTADVFNANPGVYNPETKKTWTVKVLPVNGLTLEWLLDLAVSPLFGLRSAGTALSASGVELEMGTTRAQSVAKKRADEAPVAEPDHRVSLDEVQRIAAKNPYKAFELPLLANPADEDWETSGLTARGHSWNPLKIFALNVKIGGSPINPLKTYRVAMGSGFLQSIVTLNTFLKKIPMDGLFDSGIEAWRAMRDYIHVASPITSEKLGVGTRFLIRGPDLGLLYDDVQWAPRLRTAAGTLARIKVRVRNFGLQTSPAGAKLAVFTNRRGSDQVMDPELVAITDVRSVPAIEPGKEMSFIWDSVLIPDHIGLATVTAVVQPVKKESNSKNNQATRYFRVPENLLGLR